MSKQFVIVVYDVSSDKRRTKLHNTLLDFGSPVQYSVFECLLDQKELEKMKQEVMRVIKPRVDQVRFYYICAACLKKVEITIGRDVLTDDSSAMIIS